MRLRSLPSSVSTNWSTTSGRRWPIESPSCEFKVHPLTTIWVVINRGKTILEKKAMSLCMLEMLSDICELLVRQHNIHVYNTCIVLV